MESMTDTEYQMIENIVIENRICDLKKKIRYKSIFENFSQYFEIIGTIFSLLGIIFNFSSTYYTSHFYAFLSGILNSVSIISLKFSSYLAKEYLQKKEEIKLELHKMDLPF